jgi:hypothetical protein
MGLPKTSFDCQAQLYGMQWLEWVGPKDKDYLDAVSGPVPAGTAEAIESCYERHKIPY